MARKTEKTTLAQIDADNPIDQVQIRLNSALERLEDIRRIALRLEKEHGEAVALLQRALRVHDKWFGTPGDIIRAGEAVDDVRLWLQTNGHECAWSSQYEDKVRELAGKGLRVDGRSKLEPDDWRPDDG